MLADFFTKPLQGSLFRKFREVIMGHRHIDSLKEATPTPTQERVGEDISPKNSGDGADGQRTDVVVREPHAATYADVVKKGR
jgi:hypothetical protein